VKIDLVSTDALRAIQLVYAGKSEGLEFDTVWIVGQDEGRCALLADYAAIGKFTLRFIPNHRAPELTESLRARAVDLLLQIGSVMFRGDLLSAPSIGVLNLHAGMLPRYRGLDSAEWAVLEGGVHGVSAHLLSPGVDTGPIVLTEEVPMVAGETVGQLLGRTHNRHKWQVFVRAACALRDGTLRARAQRPEDGRQYFAMHPRLLAVAGEVLAQGAPPTGS
jgi:methionyl-tRNA formyltransferase